MFIQRTLDSNYRYSIVLPAESISNYRDRFVGIVAGNRLLQIQTSGLKRVNSATIMATTISAEYKVQLQGYYYTWPFPQCSGASPEQEKDTQTQTGQKWAAKFPGRL